MQDKKQQLEPDMEKRTDSKLGKEYIKAVCCHSAYLTSMQSTSCKMPGWMKQKLDSRLLGEREEELKNLLMKVKEESEKAGLKLNIQKMNIMTSGPITSWQIDGETMETVADFIFLGFKITARVIAAMKLKDPYSLEEKL